MDSTSGSFAALSMKRTTVEYESYGWCSNISRSRSRLKRAAGSGGSPHSYPYSTTLRIWTVTECTIQRNAPGVSWSPIPFLWAGKPGTRHVCLRQSVPSALTLWVPSTFSRALRPLDRAGPVRLCLVRAGVVDDVAADPAPSWRPYRPSIKLRPKRQQRGTTEAAFTQR